MPVDAKKAKYKCRGPRVKDSTDRVGCGTILNDLINEVQQDGEVHEITCPSCGTVISVRRAKVA